MRTSFRAAVAALLSLGLIIASLVATTEPASATTTCQISVTGLPSKITIDSGYRRPWVKGWAKGCNLDKTYSDVYADIVGPNNLRDYADDIWTGFDRSDHITLFSSGYKAGTYTVVDSMSTIVDDDYNDLRYTWVKKTFVAKYRTYTTLKATRSGASVRLSGTVKRYSPDWYGYVAHNRPVAIQRYSDGKWRTIKTVTSARGKFSYSYKIRKKASYRAKIGETTASLASVSGTKSAPSASRTR